MKKLLSLLCIVLSCGLFSACSAPVSKETVTGDVTVIEDVEQFSRITIDELTSIMGEPASEEQWVNKTNKGDFNVTTLQYDKNSNHYEFILADDAIVRVSIYSENYWNGTGDRFSFSGDKKDIARSFNITLGENAKKITDNNTTYTLSPVNDKVAEFDVQDVNSDTYGFVKITYNLNYFD